MLRSQGAKRSFFVRSLAVVLACTGVLKLLSLFGNISSNSENATFPWLPGNTTQVILVVGSLEVLGAVWLWWARDSLLKFGVIVWVAFVVLSYRLLVEFMEVPGSCGCLGVLGDMLSWSPRTVSRVSGLILTGALLGGVFKIREMLREMADAVSGGTGCSLDKV